MVFSMSECYMCLELPADDEMLEVAAPLLSKLLDCNIQFEMDPRSQQVGTAQIIKIHFPDKANLTKALLVCEGIKCVVINEEACTGPHQNI